jgi:hypothetical protein
LQLPEHPQRRGHVIGKVGREWELYGEDGMARHQQQRDDPAVTGPVSPDPMHQHDIDAGRVSGGIELSDARGSFVGGRQGCQGRQGLRTRDQSRARGSYTKRREKAASRRARESLWLPIGVRGQTLR